MPATTLLDSQTPYVDPANLCAGQDSPVSLQGYALAARVFRSCRHVGVSLLSAVSEGAMYRTAVVVRFFWVLCLGVVLNGLCAWSAVAGHPANECKEYAQNAVNQFHALHGAGCTGMPGDALWSDNYSGHYNWCSSTNGDLGHEFKRRRLTIEQCQRHADSECRKYAENAVNQTREAVRKSCPNTAPPRWGENFQTHYDWCRTDKNADLGQEFEKRRKALEHCSSGSGAGQPGFSASMVLLPSGQHVLHVSGSGFSAGTVRISYLWTQTDPGPRNSGPGNFDVPVRGGQISGETAVNCTPGRITSISQVVATELSSGRRVTTPGGGGC